MCAAAPPPEAALTLLRELGADVVRHHAGRTLLEHLIATHDLLTGWQCTPDVAVAGLFHSIYGTSEFNTACLPPDARAQVSDVIGDGAERLAYLFSAMSRDNFLENIGQGRVKSRFGDGELCVSDDETGALCDILLANELDLAIAKKGKDRPDKIAKKVGPIFEIIGAHVSRAAADAYAEASATGN